MVRGWGGADGRIVDLEGASGYVGPTKLAVVPVMAKDGTERERTEQALRQSEQQLRNLIEGSIQGILIHDEDGKPLFVNQAFARIYGFDSPEEVLKLESLDHLIPPEDKERIISFRKARLGGEPVPESMKPSG